MTDIAGKFKEYFGSEASTARIVQTSKPGVGWSQAPGYPATMASIRGLKRKGVDLVAVQVGERIADFSVREVVEHAERPLFGGRVI